MQFVANEGEACKYGIYDVFPPLPDCGEGLACMQQGIWDAGKQGQGICTGKGKTVKIHSKIRYHNILSSLKYIIMRLIITCSKRRRILLKWKILRRILPVWRRT